MSEKFRPQDIINPATEVECPVTKAGPPAAGVDYDALLWQRIDELTDLRTPLESHLGGLYDEIEKMRTRRLNLAEEEVMVQKETEYWRIQGQIQQLSSDEERVLQLLADLEAGTIDPQVLQEFLPPPAEEKENLSKRKRRILEEKKRLGLDISEANWYAHYLDVLPREIAAPTTRLTTGRNRKGIKGQFDSYTAVGEFFDQTADTHGGKVPHGKNGKTYTTREGKRIRKK